MGNITQWATIEVMTFYLNIVVMIFYLVCARLLPEKSKEYVDETDEKKLNESILSDDHVTMQKNAQINAIKDELQKINSASDLLRSVEDERQYNKLQLLFFCICLTNTIYQSTSLSSAHSDTPPIDIPKFGRDPQMYKMYEH